MCSEAYLHLLHSSLVTALGAYADRLVSAEKADLLLGLDADTLGGRALPPRHRDRPVDAAFDECFTARTITPGVTTIMTSSGAAGRPTPTSASRSPPAPTSIHRDPALPQDEVIPPGDVLHCDTGIKYLRLNSDHQHLAYVPRRGETSAPDGLKARLADNLRLQDVSFAASSAQVGERHAPRHARRGRAPGHPGAKSIPTTSGSSCTSRGR